MKKWIIGLMLMFARQILLAQQTDGVYLFSYFKDNGQDGLHLAYSYDGFKWTALKNDKSFAIGNNTGINDIKSFIV